LIFDGIVKLKRKIKRIKEPKGKKMRIKIEIKNKKKI
jgi:hypothetical protein